MADSTWQAATSAQRQVLKEKVEKAAGIMIPSNDSGVGPTSYRAGFDVDGAGTELGAALADLGYAGAALNSNQTVLTNGGSVSLEDADGTPKQVGTAQVANSTLNKIVLEGSAAIVAAGTVTVEGKDVTLEVSSGTPSYSLKNDTDAIVSSGDQVLIGDSGYNVALTVAGKKVTGSAFLAETRAVVADTDTIPVQNSAGSAIDNGTLTVADNKATAIKLPATTAGIKNSGTLPIQNSAGAAIDTGTATVASGVVSAVKLPATTAGIKNGASVVVQNSAGAQATSAATATVASGVVSAVKLPATLATIANEGTFEDDTNTYTFAVANGVITGITVTAKDAG